jgi:transposase-like protein
MGIFQKGKNPGAYRGSLNCPVCHSSAIKYIEEVAICRSRWRCRKCGLAFQYDYSATFTHPYAPFKKPKWAQIVDQFERNKGSKIIGGTQ